MAAGSRLWWPLSCGYGPLQFAHSRLFELSLDVLRRVANEINPTCRALQFSVIAIDSMFFAVVRHRKQAPENFVFLLYACVLLHEFANCLWPFSGHFITVAIAR